jgi:hypothetical protein
MSTDPTNIDVSSAQLAHGTATRFSWFSINAFPPRTTQQVLLELHVQQSNAAIPCYFGPITLMRHEWAPGQSAKIDDFDVFLGQSRFSGSPQPQH